MRPIFSEENFQKVNGNSLSPNVSKNSTAASFFPPWFQPFLSKGYVKVEVGDWGTGVRLNFIATTRWEKSLFVLYKLLFNYSWIDELSLVCCVCVSKDDYWRLWNSFFFHLKVEEVASDAFMC